MRFMVMHKVDAKMEAGERPDHGVIEGMGRHIGGSIKQGIFLDGAGLHRSAVRVRLRLDGDRPQLERGPYQGDRFGNAERLMGDGPHQMDPRARALEETHRLP